MNCHYLAFPVSCIRHFISSSSPYNIHSPFVLKVAEQIMARGNTHPVFHSIEQVRSELSRNSSIIGMIDYGGGSHYHAVEIKGTCQSRHCKRKIKEIARTAIKPRQGQILFNLVQHFKPEFILELGTSLGISTAYIAAGNRAASVNTLEGNPDSAMIAEQNFRQLKLNNIIQHIGPFDEILPGLLDKTGKLDFVFIDGNHRYGALINYFNLCLAKANPGTVFVFDDIRWSKEMLKAWSEIKNHEQVSVTLDFFFFGIAFLIPNIAKQHYKLIL